MTKNEIIEEIYNTGDIITIANTWADKKYIKSSDREQFKSELYLILCEMPEEKIKRLYDKKQLMFYIIAVAKNQATNYKSKFNKMFRDKKMIYVKEYFESIFNED